MLVAHTASLLIDSACLAFLQRQLAPVDDWQSLCKVGRRIWLTRSTCGFAFHRVAQGLISPTCDGLDGRKRADIVWAKSLLSSIDSP